MLNFTFFGRNYDHFSIFKESKAMSSSEASYVIIGDYLSNHRRLSIRNIGIHIRATQKLIKRIFLLQKIYCILR